MTKLRQLAHVRTGDKGDTCQFSVIAYDPADYPRLVEHLTVERVRMHFSAFAMGQVHRFEMPQLNALVFVMEHALRSGVTRSLSLDAHGKCIGMTLLGIDLDEPRPELARAQPGSLALTGEPQQKARSVRTHLT